MTEYRGKAGYAQMIGDQLARKKRSDAIVKQLDEWLPKVGPRMGDLRCRWLDEREYEDWNDYVAEFRKLVPKSFKFERAFKNPFGFNMTHPDLPYAFHVTATTRRVRWQAIRT